jgi:hypothetical protein
MEMIEILIKIEIVVKIFYRGSCGSLAVKSALLSDALVLISSNGALFILKD